MLTLRTRALLSLAALVLVLFACTYRPQSSLVRLKLSLPQKAKVFRAVRGDNPPATVADMDCLVVNISAEDIVPKVTYDSVTKADMKCMKLGVTSELVQLGTRTEVEIKLSVPAGPKRKIQVLGVVSRATGTCTGKTTLAELFRDQKPALYEVGVAVTDLWDTKTIELKPVYSAAAAKDAVVACTGSSALPPPTLGSISPNTGPLAGGTPVTLRGTNFHSDATIALGPAICSNLVFASSTEVHCVTGSNTVPYLVADVVLTNPDTQQATLSGGFTHVRAPAVTGVTPNQGALAGGTPVTITGSGFHSASTVIKFGVDLCLSPVFVSSSSFTCQTPLHAAGSVAVVAINPDLQQGTLGSAYTFQSAPTVAGIAPTAGGAGGGTPVTITGTGFKTGATCSIGGSPCSSEQVVSSTELHALTGSHANAFFQTVTVINLDGQSGSQPSLYTYQTGPAITSLSPKGGNIIGGNTVTIAGTGFSSSTVTIDSMPCTSVVLSGSTQITCSVPSRALTGSVDVKVDNIDTTSDTKVGGYTYQDPPDVNSGPLSPAAGPASGGTTVLINGSGFLAGLTVTLGGASCTDVGVNSATQISCKTPAHAGGLVNVSVSNDDGQSDTELNVYTYNVGPAITSVAPSSVGVPNFSSVAVNGSGFTPTTTLRFRGTSCPSPYVNAAQLTCVPNLPQGQAEVKVTNPDSQSYTLFNGFLFGTGNAWRAVSADVSAPSGREGFSAVWTGTDMLVWGGKIGSLMQDTGGQFNPADNTWAAIPASGATRSPSARLGHSAVWTGNKMIVWGGAPFGLADGASFTGPPSNTWTNISTTNQPAGRFEHSTIWTGSKMIIWGGSGNAGYLSDGASYDPAGNTWTALPSSGLTARKRHTAVWTGSKMIIWGGQDLGGQAGDGMSYNPQTNIWAPLPSLGTPPVARREHTAVWTGSKMIIWGGTTSGGATNTGAQYDLGSGTWTATSVSGPAPSARTNHSAVWIGNRMIVMSGRNTSATTDSGAIYNPDLDTWATVTGTHAPTKRTLPALLWTGSEMILWGGADLFTYPTTHGLYSPTL